MPCTKTGQLFPGPCPEDQSPAIVLGPAREERQKSATGVARHRLGERETIGSVATRALTEDPVEMEFRTDDPVAQAVNLPASDIRRAGTTLRPLLLGE